MELMVVSFGTWFARLSVAQIWGFFSNIVYNIVCGFAVEPDLPAQTFSDCQGSSPIAGGFARSPVIRLFK